MRNPLDAVVSVFNLFSTGSHDLSVGEDTYTRFSNCWADFVDQEVAIWNDFYKWWLASKIPVHIVRYEDLVKKPESVLTDLMQFILNVETLKDTRVEQYIKIATA